MTARQPKFEPGHGYTQEDWDAVDCPELTDEQLAQGKPFAEVFPEIAAKMRRTRGPQKAPTKEMVSLRLDRDTVSAYRAMGPGWQSKVNDILKKALAG